MAIGIGKTLNFDLTKNFERPYFATSITQFWHKWHISLSVWLKDYIYIPCGGSRCSKLRSYINILITFLVSGIWHGANWTYIIWGLIHGLIQIMEKILGIQHINQSSKLKLVRIPITFLIIHFDWIFFRMPRLKDALHFIAKIFTDFRLDLYLPEKSNIAFMFIGILILITKEFFDEFFPNKLNLFDNSNIIIRWSSYSMLIIIILLIGIFDAVQFIYVNF